MVAKELSVEERYLKYTASPYRMPASELIDRLFRDFTKYDISSGALIVGEGKLHGKDWRATVIAQQKWDIYKEGDQYISRGGKRNFGMLTTEQHYQIIDVLKESEKKIQPVLSIIDTPGATPIEPAIYKGISDCIKAYIYAKTPLISLNLGMGGSGGAIAIYVADYYLMLLHAILATIRPESCGPILWDDPERLEDALNVLNPFSERVQQLELVDKVIYETVQPPEVDKLKILHEKGASYIEAENIGKALNSHYNSMYLMIEPAVIEGFQYLHDLAYEDGSWNMDKLIPLRHNRTMNYGLKLEEDSRAQKVWYWVRKHIPRKKIRKLSAKLVKYGVKPLGHLESALLEHTEAVKAHEIDPSNPIIKCLKRINIKDELDKEGKPVYDEEGEKKTKSEIIGCGKTFSRDEYLANYRSCPHCDMPLEPISSERWIECLGLSEVKEVNDDLKLEELIERRFISGEYGNKIKTKLEDGFNEALKTVVAKINDYRVGIAISEFPFMGGTLSVVVGEKLRRWADLCAEYKLPIVIISCAGGARMQEGTLSLVQMPKTNLVIGEYKKTGLPYISILSDPCTGGTIASYAAQGDITITEPKALISFAGPKVTLKAGLPYEERNFLAEAHEKAGRVLSIVPRRKMGAALESYLMMYFSGNPQYQKICRKPLGLPKTKT